METERLSEPLAAGLRDAVEKVRALYESARETDCEPAILREILDLEAALLDATRREGELGQALDALARRLAGRDRLRFDGLVCWRDGEDGEEDPHPYCPLCWDSDGRLIRLQRADPDYFEGWECRRCANHFGSRKASPPYAKRDEGTRQW